MKIGFIGLGNMGAPMAVNLIKARARDHRFRCGGHPHRRCGRCSIGVGRRARPGRGDHHAAQWRDPACGLRPDHAGGHEGRGVHRLLDGRCRQRPRRPQDGAGRTACSRSTRRCRAASAGRRRARSPSWRAAATRRFSRAPPRCSRSWAGRRCIAARPAPGSRPRICNNMLLGISMIGTCEAFALAEKLGLSAERLFDVVSTSSGSCWSVNTYCPVPGVGPQSPADNGYKPGFRRRVDAQGPEAVAAGGGKRQGADTDGRARH